MTPMRVRRSTRVLVLVLTAGMWTPALGAQERLLGVRTMTAGPVYESWRFLDGVPQRVAGDSVLVSTVSQWSIPLAVVIPLGGRVTADVAGAYSSGTVDLDGADRLNRMRYRLTGPTDVKLRLVTRVVGDKVLLTLGANAPTGKTSLDGQELAALRVLAAPAMRLQTPALGSGGGGTAGLVLARQIASWAWAFGVSYEMRGKYSPIASFTTGAPSLDFDPGDVLHFSLGMDGLVGQHGMTLALSADTYAKDEFTTSGSLGPDESTVVQLGPTASAEWQFRFAARGWRELKLYAADRYRTKYKQGGETIAGTDGNQLDGGVRGVLALSRRSSLIMGIEGRHHTGLKVDQSLATAAFVGGGATLGIVFDAGGLSIQPFARGQMGTVDTGGEKAAARGFAGGLTVGTRF